MSGQVSDQKLSFPNSQQEVGDLTCGPVALKNIYEFLGTVAPVDAILKDLKVSHKKATYLPQLATHLISRGVKTTLFSSNPFILTSEWEGKSQSALAEKLTLWLKQHKKSDAVTWRTSARFLLNYLKKGGTVQITNISTKHIDAQLEKNKLVLVCLEESWLWQHRKIKLSQTFDDIKGKPTGHFVVIFGKTAQDYLVSDPFPTKLPQRDGCYKVNKDQLLVSVLVWNPEILVIEKNK